MHDTRQRQTNGGQALRVLVELLCDLFDSLLCLAFC